MLSLFGRIMTARYLERPIIVVGGGRSGTSVLTQALGKHPDVLAFDGEAPLITDIGGMVHGLEFSDERELQYYRNSLRIDREYIYSTLRRMAFESAFGPSFGASGHFKRLLQGDLKPLTATYWCAKSFPSRIVSDGLSRLYKRVAYVLIIRNGIEVVHSRTKFHGFRDLAFEEHCDDWVNNIDAFGFISEYPCSITVRHEDLVDETAECFSRIFEAIGLRPDPSPIKFCQTTQLHPLESTSASTDIDVQKQLNARKSPFLSWTSEQRRIFVDRCGGTMHRLGYAIPESA